MSVRPHWGEGRSLQLLKTHQSLLRHSQSWPDPLQRALHVDPILQWWWAWGERIPGPVYVYCRWMKCIKSVWLFLTETSFIFTYFFMHKKYSVFVIFCKDPEFHLHAGGLLNPIPGRSTTSHNSLDQVVSQCPEKVRLHLLTSFFAPWLCFVSAVVQIVSLS